jgi:hypothetical protein
MMAEQNRGGQHVPQFDDEMFCPVTRGRSCRIAQDGGKAMRARIVAKLRARAAFLGGCSAAAELCHQAREIESEAP